MVPDRPAKPIAFQGWQVRALQENRLSLIVLPVKPQPPVGTEWRDNLFCSPGAPFGVIRIPPFEVDSLLWVRETWGVSHHYNNCPPSKIPKTTTVAIRAYGKPPYSSENRLHGRWRSPVAMPRWASRWTLRVTNVEVMRVRQTCSQLIRAEGIFPVDLSGPTECSSFEYMLGYERYWQSRYGKRYPWESNPWVWCYKVEKV